MIIYYKMIDIEIELTNRLIEEMRISRTKNNNNADKLLKELNGRLKYTKIQWKELNKINDLDEKNIKDWENIIKRYRQLIEKLSDLINI